VVGITYIQRSIVCKERWIVTLSANTRPTNWAKTVRNRVRSKAVPSHIVLARVPLDLCLEWVDHELAVDVADAAVTLGHWHLVERWAEFDGEAYVAAVTAAFVGLGAGDGFACCWGDGCLSRHDDGDCWCLRGQFVS